MTQHQIARLCFKGLAVYAVIAGVGNGQYIVWAFEQVPGAISPRVYVALSLHAFFPIAQILVGVWLWRKAGVVAAWVTGHDLQHAEDEPTVDRVPWSLEAVQTIVFSSLGVWVLIHAVPQVVNYATVVFVSPSSPDAMREMWTARVSGNLAALAARLAIGFWLVFGASNIARLVRRRLEDSAKEQGTDAP